MYVCETDTRDTLDPGSSLVGVLGTIRNLLSEQQKLVAKQCALHHNQPVSNAFSPHCQPRSVLMVWTEDELVISVVSGKRVKVWRERYTWVESEDNTLPLSLSGEASTPPQLPFPCACGGEGASKQSLKVKAMRTSPSLPWWLPQSWELPSPITGAWLRAKL